VTREERDRVRVAFMRAWRHTNALSSASVRPDGAGGWYLHVGLVRPCEAIPTRYEGLLVRTMQAPRGVPAI